MRRASSGAAAAAACLEAPPVRLVIADTPRRIQAAREIFVEYAASLSIDLGFQQFDAELATLPGAYAAPHGQLLLAQDEASGATVAFGAMRSLYDCDHANACEMKRLYVRPACRGLGFGRMLAQALLDEARRAGYSVMLLDTLDEMEGARSLYAHPRLVEIPPYYYSPVAGAHYLKADPE